MFVGFSGWQFSCIIDEEKIAQFGDFTGGFIGTLLAFAASLLYFIALKEQQKDVKTNQISLERNLAIRLKNCRRQEKYPSISMMPWQCSNSNHNSIHILTYI